MGIGSYGTKFYSSTDDVSFTEIANVVNIDAPTIQKGMFEDKSLGQSNRWIPKVGTFVNGGTVTLTTVYTGAKYAVLLAFVDDPDTTYWKITVPLESGQSAGAQIKFSGLLTELSLPFPEDGGRLLCNVTIEVSGAVTITQGS